MTFSPSLSLESFTCRLVVPALLGTVPGRMVPSVVPAPGLGTECVSQPRSKPKGHAGTLSGCWDTPAHTTAGLPYQPLCHPVSQ